MTQETNKVKEFIKNNIPDSDKNHKYLESFFNSFPYIYDYVREKIEPETVVTTKGILNITQQEYPLETNMIKLKELINNREEGFTNYRFFDYLIFFCESNPKDSKYILYNLNDRTMSFQNYGNLKDLVETFITSRLLQNVYSFFGIDTVNINDPTKEKNKQIETYIKRKTIFINGIDYCPRDEFLFIKNNSLFLNRFQPGNLFSYYEVKESYNFPYISNFIYYLCGNNENVYNWFLKWLAWKLQNPEVKVPTAVVFITPPGAGKEVFKNYILSPIFGYTNISDPDGDQVLAGWGDIYKNCLYLVIDEIAFNRKRDYETFKRNVSNQFMTTSQKHKDSQKIINFANVVIFTNRINPIKIEEKDRRFTVTELNYVKDESYFDELINERIPEEIYDFVTYLRDLNVEYKEVSKPVETETKREIQQIHRHPFDKFISAIGQEGIEDIQQNISTKVRYSDICQNYIKLHTLYTLYIDYMKHWGTPQGYQISVDRFSKNLSEKGIKSHVVRESDKNTPIRVYDIRDLHQSYRKDEIVNKEITPKSEDVEVKDDL